MRSILVAVDASDASMRALAFAAKLTAEMPETRLYVLYVRAPPRVYGEIEVYATEEEMREAAARQGDGVLDLARNVIAGRCPEVQFEQLEGDSAPTIARRAAELGCEWIVMGTHGRGRLASAVIGSTAQAVVHTASVPVMLVR